MFLRGNLIRILDGERFYDVYWGKIREFESNPMKIHGIGTRWNIINTKRLKYTQGKCTSNLYFTDT